MGNVSTRPTTWMTLIGASFWMPRTQGFGFGADGINSFVAFILLIPFAYCIYRLLLAPLGNPDWPIAIVALLVGVISVVGTASSIAGGYFDWVVIPWAVATITFLVFAQRNWTALRSN